MDFVERVPLHKGPKTIFFKSQGNCRDGQGCRDNLGARLVIFMNLQKYFSRLGLLPAFWLAIVLVGCSSTQSSNYPTLRQTDIHVSWPMTHYRDAAAFGRLTLGEKERINAAYSAYETAYNQALQAAHGNRDAPTPDNVKALANEVVRVISATPMISSVP
jgi:hypothetical protein